MKRKTDQCYHNLIIIICDAIPLVTLMDFRPYCLNWTSVGGVLAVIDGYLRDSLRWPQLCITWSSLRLTMWRDQAHQCLLHLCRCYFWWALSPQSASLWQLACKKKHDEWEFNQWPWSLRYCQIWELWEVCSSRMKRWAPYVNRIIALAFEFSQCVTLHHIVNVTIFMCIMFVCALAHSKA